MEIEKFQREMSEKDESSRPISEAGALARKFSQTSLMPKELVGRLLLTQVPDWCFYDYTKIEPINPSFESNHADDRYVWNPKIIKDETKWLLEVAPALRHFDIDSFKIGLDNMIEFGNMGDIYLLPYINFGDAESAVGREAEFRRKHSIHIPEFILFSWEQIRDLEKIVNSALENKL